MRPTFWQRLDNLARNLTPLGLTFLLVILNVVPTHIPGLARVLPILPLISIFYWSIHRPHLMPAVAVFMIGLAQDALTGAPLGLHTLIFLIVQCVLLYQHRFFMGKSFTVHWVGFVLVGGGASALAWVLLSAYHTTIFSGQAILCQFVMTFAAFPLLAFFFSRWQQAFLRQD
ncbi:MAG: rod shape-determining protein MreD [Rhodospirillaceae bacterium]